MELNDPTVFFSSFWAILLIAGVLAIVIYSFMRKGKKNIFTKIIPPIDATQVLIVLIVLALVVIIIFDEIVKFIYASGLAVGFILIFLPITILYVIALFEVKSLISNKKSQKAFEWEYDLSPKLGLGAIIFGGFVPAVLAIGAGLQLFANSFNFQNESLMVTIFIVIQLLIICYGLIRNFVILFLTAAIYEMSTGNLGMETAAKTVSAEILLNVSQSKKKVLFASILTILIFCGNLVIGLHWVASAFYTIIIAQTVTVIIK
ncbi:MAG: hypothetical protein WC308_00095 [archaeon]|jgi:hypothetical protein